ncbi:MAG: exodeoxyribonuclease VII small subunit [Gemmatimonadales bacterium]|nr:MAG: exodeoxyribonuclease VII small subunit [Gemmatimonadales bacterium]
MAERKRTLAKKLSFGEAVREVEEILAGLEADEVDIDQLGDQVGRAVELIQVCRQKLEKTDREVRDLVSGLSAEPGTGDAEAAPDEPGAGGGPL